MLAVKVIIKDCSFWK